MKPEQTFRAGGISASVWKSEIQHKGQTIESRTVTFQKRYKDKDGSWKTSSTLHQTDVPKAVMVLTKAYEFVALKDEKTVTENDVGRENGVKASP